MRGLLLAGIRLYRATLSGWLGGQCRFYPTCSAYAEEAIRARGAIRGSGLAIWRILRCNPFGAGGVDHVPKARREYDDVILDMHATSAWTARHRSGGRLMLAGTIPIISDLFQACSNGIGLGPGADLRRHPQLRGRRSSCSTLLIRFLLLPLGMKQIKSMQHMQAIQPKIKEIQKKYKGNKQKAQEETMKLYKEAGVNPLGGCLPLLLQFPILIAMYAVIRAPSARSRRSIRRARRTSSTTTTSRSTARCSTTSIAAQNTRACSS